MRNETEKIVLSGFFISLGAVLAVIFHNLGLGQKISPMHFTVFIAGITLGWKYGLAVGIITPLMNAILFGAPPLFPIAVGMSLELATYGVVISIIYQYVKPSTNNIINIYIALIISMIVGRIVYGLYYTVVSNIIEYEFGFKIFINSVIILSLPGIVFQILFIPPIVNYLEKKEF